MKYRCPIFVMLAVFWVFSLSGSLSAQYLQVELEQSLLENARLKAVMVSNQYGVLRYFAFGHKLDQSQPHRFSIRARRGESLALTLVQEEERNGQYSFQNTTYTALADSVVIGQPGSSGVQGSGFNRVKLQISGVNGAEDVKMLGPVQGRTEYRMNDGQLQVKSRLQDSTGIFALFRLPEEQRYRYLLMPQQEEIAISREELGDSTVAEVLRLPFAGQWRGSIRGMKNGLPYYLFYQPRALRKPVDSIVYYRPVGQAFDSLLLSLSALQEVGGAYFGTYQALPTRLDTFPFESRFTSLDSKGYTFRVPEEGAQYYAVSYYYSLGAGQPIPSWHIWGEMAGSDSIDFILPDLPAELYDILPELEVVADPIAVDKTAFRCTRNCGDLPYRRRPAALQENRTRVYHNFMTRRRLRDFEE